MRPLLIINADDLGYDPEVTRGILEAMREGVVRSATLMVNTPYSEPAARSAQGLAVGLHFNLTRFGPVWGDFPPEWLDQGRLQESQAGTLPIEVVEREALAQASRLEALMGAPPTHLDVHKHLHRLPNVLAGVARAAVQKGLPVRSVDAGMRRFLQDHGVRTNDHFIGDAGAEAYWTLDRLREQLQQLPTRGVIELMCHPGYAPQTTRSGYHQQREVELATFLSPQARALLSSIQLTDFRVLSGG